MDNEGQTTVSQLDKYLPEKIRHKIELDYYTKITEQARLEVIMRDPDFLQNPLDHITLLANHGIVHVRAVAMSVLNILNTMNGIHFPARLSNRLEFMKGYGVLVAFLHEIGMIDASIQGHDMHPEYSAQAIYGDLFDENLTRIWEENCGNIPWRLAKLSYQGLLHQPPKTILREMCALTCAHTPDCIPTSILSHPEALRREIQIILRHSLPYLWYQKQLNEARAKLVSMTHNSDQYESVVTAEKYAQAEFDKALASGKISDKNNSFLELYYKDFAKESFQWLVDEHPELQELRDDVIDTLRALRAANASRDHGLGLRSSGSYQIFLDQVTGNAIYSIALRDQTFLLESANTTVVGDVNITGTHFTEEGDLRIAFHRGLFMDPKAVERVSFNVAIVINEVQSNMIDAFARPEGTPTSADYHKKHQPVNLLLENTDDNPHFTAIVAQQLETLNPDLKHRIRLVPSLQEILPAERERYLAAKEVDWDLKTRIDVLQKISKSGHKIEKMDPNLAFSNVRTIDLLPGERLIEAGSRSSFVYIPLAEGLVGYPMEGFQPFYSHAWVPLGNIGVIRGDIRSATILAEQQLQLLIIPKETYLKYWHFTYTEEEFINLLKTSDILKK